MNTDTNTKIALLRRVFAALDLDPEDLVFTLRPNADDATNNATAAAGTSGADTVEITGTYAALTKFGDAVAEAEALKSSPETTADLRAEFAGEFEEFKRDTWIQDLGGQPLAAFTTATPVDQMTAEQVLAVISGMFAMETMFGPGAVHQSITDGSMSEYLRRLEELGQVELHQ